MTRPPLRMEMRLVPPTLDPIFEPRSIAVVGASADPGKRGHQILRALAESGYAGRVHAVNPAGGELFGHVLHRSVLDLPESVDLAVLCTPGATTPDLVEQCGERGIFGAVVLAVGFGESGTVGERLEAQLREAGRKHAVRIVGPNTSGILNLPLGLNLIGASGIRAGKIALLVQSGNIALALMDEITERTGMGVSICCGLGNEVDVGFGEVLHYLGNHKGTAAVVMHVEGCKNAKALLAAASDMAWQKPVVAIKSGRSEAGARAALSHTGAVAGPYERLRAGFRQAGVIEVERTDELVHVVSTLASQPRMLGDGVGILSDGGGQSTLVVDRLQEMGVPLARLSPETSRRLGARLGPAAAVQTPVDVAGAADSNPAAFPRALEAIADDPAVGAVLLVGLFGGYAIRFDPALADAEADAARAMAAMMRARGKGLVAHSQYAARESGALDALRKAGVPVIRSLEGACRAVAELERHSAGRASVAWGGPLDPSPRGDRGDRRGRSTHPVIKAARRDKRATLSETDSRTLLRDAGAVFDDVEVTENAQEAAAAFGRFRGAAALKLVSQHISHKSDAGGVALNVRTALAAGRAFDKIVADARAYAEAQGLPREDYQVSVSPMFPPPVAELLVGAYRDPGLGPVLTIGAGGVWVEVLRDVAHRVLPVYRAEVMSAIGELKVCALLDGARGGEPVQRGPILDACAAVADCVATWPDIEEVEINPLFVYGDKVVPVDARVVLGPE